MSLRYLAFAALALLAACGGGHSESSPAPSPAAAPLQRPADGAVNNGRAVLAHDGEYGGFSSLVVIDRQGRSASFGITNTQADDGTWALTVLSQAVVDIERALQPQ